MRKKIRILVIAMTITGALLGMGGLAGGDILPQNSHNVARYISIVNAEDFPEVVLVAYVTGPMLQEPEVKEIRSGEYLSKGYKFNRYRIFAVPRNLLSKTGSRGLRFQDVPSNGKVSSEGIALLSDSIDPGTKSVTNENPLVAEHLEYQLLKNRDGTFRLVLAKETREYDYTRYGAEATGSSGEGGVDGTPGTHDRGKAGSSDS
jgi:hypothetical protein